MKNRKIHYAWIILIACCLLQIGGLGSLSNTSSTFIQAVCTDRNLEFVAKEFDAAAVAENFKPLDEVKYKTQEELESAKIELCGSVEAYDAMKKAYTESYSKAQSTFTIYMAIQGIATALILPFAGKFLQKVNLRVVMSIGTILLCGTFAAMSRFTAMWQWYLAGVLMGIGSTVVFTLPAPVMIGNWFRKKTGLAMGLALACSNIGGAIMNPVLQSVVGDNNNWSKAYIVAAIVSLVAVLPCALFIVRFKPSDVGMQPYGAEETAAGTAGAPASLPGVSAKAATKSLAFYLVAITIAFLTYNTLLINLAQGYGASVGFSNSMRALVPSVILVCGILFKILLGWLNDKLGITKTIVIGSITAIVAFCALISVGFVSTANAKITLVFAGCALLGAISALVGTCPPLVVRKLFGVKEFSAIYGYITAVMSFSGALGMFIMPKLIEKGHGITAFASIGGGYTFAFIISAVLCLAALVCLLAAFKCGEKITQE